ncbi:MAG: Gfo/Idh/MocA family oxidoreductase [Bacteroidota bacterium]
MSKSSSRSLSRRDFLKRGSMGAVLGFTAHSEATAQAASPASSLSDEAVNCGLIGFGPQGRELAATLARIPEANVAAVCDTYDVMLKRAARSVPDATGHSDYREVLDNQGITTVLVATPTHQHRDIVMDALDAGKHVYVEAPMAATIEDARTMALAAQARPKQIFQVGQKYRLNPLYRDVFQFVRSGAVGRYITARSQWNTKESWRRASPNREREQAINWRLDAGVSLGLIGERGIHQFDTAMWYFGERPKAVTGSGQLVLWDDGRAVPDTIQAIFEYPSGLHHTYNATIASSFDDMYDMFYGSDSTIMMRDKKAWMFKEVDAPVLGWEVYARKDDFYKEKGIALVANATQLDALEQDATYDDPNVESPLWYALKDFMTNHEFGPYPSAAGFQQGYEAVVVAVKANEAIVNNTRVEIGDDLFALG